MPSPEFNVSSENPTVSEVTSEQVSSEIFENIDRTEYNRRQFQLLTKVFKLQLEYVKYLHDQTGQPIVNLLREYSCVVGMYDEGIAKFADGKDISSQLDELGVDLNSALSQVSADLSPENYAETAWLVVEEYRRRAIEIAKGKLDEYEPKLIGSFDCDFVSAAAARPVANDARYKFDLPPGAGYLELHFPASSILKNIGVEPVGPRESLKRIAVVIKRHYPDVEAVVARSWLTSTDLAQKMGFQKIDNPDTNLFPFKEMGYWLQAINDQGEINPKTKKYLFENGKLPYDRNFAKIDVKEFLHRYLPEDEKGKIQLYHVRGDFDSERLLNEMNIEFGYFYQLYEYVTEIDNEDLFSMFEVNMPIYRRYVDKDQIFKLFDLWRNGKKEDQDFPKLPDEFYNELETRLKKDILKEIIVDIQ